MCVCVQMRIYRHFGFSRFPEGDTLPVADLELCEEGDKHGREASIPFSFLQWRRQLWGIGARASPFDFQQFYF